MTQHEKKQPTLDPSKIRFCAVFGAYMHERQLQHPAAFELPRGVGKVMHLMVSVESLCVANVALSFMNHYDGDRLASTVINRALGRPKYTIPVESTIDLSKTDEIC